MFNVGTAMVRAMVDINPLRQGFRQAEQESRNSARQIDANLRQVNQSVKQSGEEVSAMGRIWKGVLSGIGFGVGISTWRTILGGLQGAWGAVSGAIVGANVEVESVRAQLMSFTKDAGQTTAILKMVREEADKTPFSFRELSAAVAGLMPAARQAQVPLMELTRTAEILAASNPAQGLQGAAFSLREAASGDFTSIIERFNLSRESINRLKKEGIPNIEIVRRAMAEMGYDMDLVSNMSKTFEGRMSTLGDAFASISLRLTTPIFEVLKFGLEDLGGFMERNMTTFLAWGDTIGAVLGRVSEDILLTIKMMLTALLDLPEGIARAAQLSQDAFTSLVQGMNGQWGGWEDESINVFVRVFGRLGQLANDAAITVQQAWAGDWLPSSSIQPAVNMLGILTNGLRTLVNDGLNAASAGFAAVGDAAQTGLAIAQNALVGVQNWLTGMVNQFNDYADAAYTYGSNFVVSFANGIIGGSEVLVEGLNYIGDILSYWLEPHSPPKIAPNLDKWGQETGEVYVRGMGEASTEGITQLGGKITGGLKILTGTVADQAGDVATAISTRLITRIGTGLADVAPAMAKFGFDLTTQMMGGFDPSDFAMFDSLTGSVQQMIGSLSSMGQFPEEGVIPAVLGTRTAMAELLANLNTTGQISAELLNNLVAAAGPAGDQVRIMAEAYAELAQQSQRVESAQEVVTRAQEDAERAAKELETAQRELNGITEEYDRRLEPLKGRLDEITEAQRALNDIQRERQLSDAMEDSDDPRLKRLQELEREERRVRDEQRKGELEKILNGQAYAEQEQRLNETLNSDKSSDAQKEKARRDLAELQEKKARDQAKARIEQEQIGLEAERDAITEQRKERDRALEQEKPRLELAASRTKNEIHGTEQERDAATKAARDRIKGLQDVVDKAKEQLQLAQEALKVETDAARKIEDRIAQQKRLIDQQIKTNDLHKQQADLLKRQADEAKRVADETKRAAEQAAKQAEAEAKKASGGAGGKMVDTDGDGVPDTKVGGTGGTNAGGQRGVQPLPRPGGRAAPPGGAGAKTPGVPDGTATPERQRLTEPTYLKDLREASKRAAEAYDDLVAKVTFGANVMTAVLRSPNDAMRTLIAILPTDAGKGLVNLVAGFQRVKNETTATWNAAKPLVLGLMGLATQAPTALRKLEVQFMILQDRTYAWWESIKPIRDAVTAVATAFVGLGMYAGPIITKLAGDASKQFDRLEMSVMRGVTQVKEMARNFADMAKAEWANPQKFTGLVLFAKDLVWVFEERVVPAFNKFRDELPKIGDALGRFITQERVDVITKLADDIGSLLLRIASSRFLDLLIPLEAIVVALPGAIAGLIDFTGALIDAVGWLQKSSDWGWAYHGALVAIGVWFGLNLLSDMGKHVNAVGGAFADAAKSADDFARHAARGPIAAKNAWDAAWKAATQYANAVRGVPGPQTSVAGRAGQTTSNVINTVRNTTETVARSVVSTLSTVFASAKDAVIWAQLYGEQGVEWLTKAITIKMPDKLTLPNPDPVTVKVNYDTSGAPKSGGDAPKPPAANIGEAAAQGLAGGGGAAAGTAIMSELIKAITKSGPQVGLVLAGVVATAAIFAGAAAAGLMAREFVDNWLAQYPTIGDALGDLFTRIIPYAIGKAAATVVNGVMQFGIWMVEGFAIIGGQIGEFISTNWSTILQVAILGIVGPIPALFIAGFQAIWPELQAMGRGIGTAIDGWWDRTQEAIGNFFINVRTAFDNGWQNIVNILINTKDKLIKAVDDAFRPLAEMIENIMRGDWGGAVRKGFEFLYNIFVELPTRVRTIIGDGLKGVFTEFVNFATVVLVEINTLKTNLFNAFTTALGDILKVVGTELTNIWNKAVQFGKDVVSTVQGAWDDVIKGVGTFFQNLGTGFDENLNKTLLDKVKSFGTQARDAVLNAFGEVRDKIGGIFDAIGTNIQNSLSGPVGAIKGFVNGIKDAINWIGKALSGKDIITTAPPMIAGYAGGLLPGGAASGGQWAWVGEGNDGRASGSELAYLAPGSVVVPHQQSMQLVEKGAIHGPEDADRSRGNFGSGNLPGFATGLNFMDIFNMIKGGKEAVFEKAIQAAGVTIPEIAGEIGAIVPAMFGKIKDVALDAIEDLIKKAMPYGSDSIGRMLAFAESQSGLPYIWGGGHGGRLGPNDFEGGPGFGFDCSGFVAAVLNAGGIPNPGGNVTTLYEWGEEGRTGMVDIGISDPYADPRQQHTGIGIAGRWFEAGGRAGGVGPTADYFPIIVHPPGLEAAIGAAAAMAMGNGQAPDNVQAPPHVLNWLTQGMALGGVGMDWLTGLDIIARYESNYNPSAINLNDVNAANGNPSKGLMQVISDHFLPGEDAYNPVDNVHAAIRYIKRRYSNHVNNTPGVRSILSGGDYLPYANGGWINELIYGIGESGQKYLFGEAGPEMIIPKDTVKPRALPNTSNTPSVQDVGEAIRLGMGGGAQWVEPMTQVIAKLHKMVEEKTDAVIQLLNKLVEKVNVPQSTPVITTPSSGPTTATPPTTGPAPKGAPAPTAPTAPAGPPAPSKPKATPAPGSKYTDVRVMVNGKPLEPDPEVPDLYIDTTTGNRYGVSDQGVEPVDIGLEGELIGRYSKYIYRKAKPRTQPSPTPASALAPPDRGGPLRTDPSGKPINEDGTPYTGKPMDPWVTFAGKLPERPPMTATDIANAIPPTPANPARAAAANNPPAPVADPKNALRKIVVQYDPMITIGGQAIVGAVTTDEIAIDNLTDAVTEIQARELAALPAPNSGTQTSSPGGGRR